MRIKFEQACECADTAPQGSWNVITDMVEWSPGDPIEVIPTVVCGVCGAAYLENHTKAHGQAADLKRLSDMVTNTRNG